MTITERDPTSPRSFRDYSRLFLRIARLCRRDGIGQIHCGKVLPEGFVALLAKVLLRVPYVLYCHGEEIPTSLTSRRYRFLLPLIYKNAIRVIANADNTKRLLREIGVSERKIRVIYPSVPVEDFREAAAAGEKVRRAHDLGDDPVLLTVGRLQRRKGHDKVIEALPRIRSRIPGTRYVIVGGGEERGRLEELAERCGVSDQVVFAGLVSDEELAGYYGACDVFVMPNREVKGDFEGFGIVFLEAAAAGKPVIGGKSGGAREAVVEGVSGLLVDGTSSEEVAEAVCSLLVRPEEARAMGAAGWERARNEFSYDEAAADLESIIDDAPGRPAKAPAQRAAFVPGRRRHRERSGTPEGP